MAHRQAGSRFSSFEFPVESKVVRAVAGNPTRRYPANPSFNRTLVKLACFGKAGAGAG